jgi:NTE family protein
MTRLLILCFTLLLAGCATSPVQNNFPQKEPPKTYFENQHPEVILVLGSGGARGFSHVGVLKVLEENHIPVDMIIGTSAGSIVGALYSDQPSADRVRKLLLEAKREKVIDFSFLGIPTGAISGKGLQEFLTTNMRAKNFEQTKIPYAAIATDFEAGRMHVFASGPIAPAVNASSAAPPFFRPVKLYGKTYADGGLIDPVAVDVAKRFHPKVIIAVRLDSVLSKEMPTYSPGFFLRGFDMMLLQLSQYSAQGANVVIVPDVGDINMFADSGRAASMNAGMKAARKALPAIKKLLAENHIRLSE